MMAMHRVLWRTQGIWGDSFVWSSGNIVTQCWSLPWVYFHERVPQWLLQGDHKTCTKMSHELLLTFKSPRPFRHFEAVSYTFLTIPSN